MVSTRGAGAEAACERLDRVQGVQGVQGPPGAQGPQGLAGTARRLALGNTLTTVDGSTNVGAENSITIGADGLPLISYADAGSGHLKVVHCQNVSCSSVDPPQTVDNSSSGVGEYTSITIGADGLPIVSYYQYGGSGSLKVAHCGSVYCVPYFRRR